MARDKSHLEILVSIADIADLVGATGSAVVTNWRARFPTFPQPRVTGSQPRFDLDEVLDWLRHDGPRSRRIPVPDPAWRWERLVDAFVTLHPAAEGRAALVALVAAHRLAGDSDEWRGVLAGDEAGGALRRLAARAETAAGDWGPLLRGRLAERLRAVPGSADHLAQLAGVLDDLGGTSTDPLDAVLDLEVSERRRSPQRSRPSIARVMVAMAAVTPDDTVLDPAAGEGDVLVECVRRRAQVEGQEIDPAAWFVAMVRLMLAGSRPVRAMAGRDSIRDDQFVGERFSVVVLDPPVGGDHSLARWLHHAADHLTPDGRLLIVMPLGDLVTVPAVRRRYDAKLRAHLDQLLVRARVEGHHLDGVVVVPRGPRTDVTGPLAILAIAGPDRPGALSDVPVAWVAGDSRSPDSVVDEFIASMGRGGVRDLVDQTIDGVAITTTTVADLYETLEAMVARSETAGASSLRRSGERRPRADERDRRRASAESSEALRFDPLTAAATDIAPEMAAALTSLPAWRSMGVSGGDDGTASMIAALAAVRGVLEAADQGEATLGADLRRALEQAAGDLAAAITRRQPAR